MTNLLGKSQQMKFIVTCGIVALSIIGLRYLVGIFGMLYEFIADDSDEDGLVALTSGDNYDEDKDKETVDA